MQKKTIILYLITLILQIGFSLLGEETRVFSSILKGLLMPILIFSILKSSHLFLNKFLVIALIFAWFGDLFLIFEGDSFFMAGLGSFLIMQLIYQYLFWKNLSFFRWINPMNILFLLLIITYVFGMMNYLNPHLKEGLFWPVFVYASSLGITFLLAGWNMFFNSSKQNKYLFLGAFLFLFSDSSLAINIFVQKLPYSPILIMGTYGMAQFYLAKGLKISYSN